MKKFTEPSLCLLKYLYWESAQMTREKDKVYHCKKCDYKQRCPELAEHIFKQFQDFVKEEFGLTVVKKQETAEPSTFKSLFGIDIEDIKEDK